MTLFDPGPPTVKKKRPRSVTAADIASGKAPVWEITVGTARHYVRGIDEADARARWRFRFQHTRVLIGDDEIRVKRLLHEDLVELFRIDPRLARRIQRLA